MHCVSNFTLCVKDKDFTLGAKICSKHSFLRLLWYFFYTWEIFLHLRRR